MYLPYFGLELESKKKVVGIWHMSASISYYPSRLFCDIIPIHTILVNINCWTSISETSVSYSAGYVTLEIPACTLVWYWHAQTAYMFASASPVLSCGCRAYLCHDQGKRCVLQRLTEHATGVVIAFFLSW